MGMALHLLVFLQFLLCLGHSSHHFARHEGFTTWNHGQAKEPAQSYVEMRKKLNSLIEESKMQGGVNQDLTSQKLGLSGAPKELRAPAFQGRVPLPRRYMGVKNEEGPKQHQKARRLDGHSTPPESPPMAVHITDQDPGEEWVAGFIRVECAASEDGIDLYEVEVWADNKLLVKITVDTCTKMQSYLGGAMPTEVSYWLSALETPPESAIRAFSYSHTGGKSNNTVVSGIMDFVDDSLPAISVSDDRDPGWRMFGGVDVMWRPSKADPYGNYSVFFSDEQCNMYGEPLLSMDWAPSVIPQYPYVWCWMDCSYINYFHYSNGTAHIDQRRYWLPLPNTGNWTNVSGIEVAINVQGPALITMVKSGEDVTGEFIIKDYDFYSASDTLPDIIVPAWQTIPIKWRPSGFGANYDGWALRVEPYSPPREPDTLRLPDGIMIPEGASSIAIKKDTSTNCTRTRLFDTVPPEEVAAEVGFGDTDTRMSFIGGIVHITRSLPTSEKAIDFLIYPGFSGGQVDWENLLASIIAEPNDSMVEAEIPAGTPWYATELVVVAWNFSGEAVDQFRLPIHDVRWPQFAPSFGEFRDTAPESGVVGGSLTLYPHVNDESSTHWAIYWASVNGTEMGERWMVEQAGIPRCYGPSCHLLSWHRGGEFWNISRIGYGNLEDLVLTLPSPGLFQLEADLFKGQGLFYDVLTVYGSELFGKVLYPPTQVWGTNVSFHSSWRATMRNTSYARELGPLHSWELLHVFTGEPVIHIDPMEIPEGVAGFFVKAATMDGESTHSLFVPIQDWAPPMVKASAVTFTDENLMPGMIRGSVIITRDTSDTSAGVKEYCVDLVSMSSGKRHRIGCAEPLSNPLMVELSDTNVTDDGGNSSGNFSMGEPSQDLWIAVFANGDGQPAHDGTYIPVMDVHGLSVAPVVTPYITHGADPSTIALTMQNAAGMDFDVNVTFHNIESACGYDNVLEMEDMYDGGGGEPTAGPDPANPSPGPDPGPGPFRRLPEEAPTAKLGNRIAFKLEEARVEDEALEQTLATNYGLKVEAQQFKGWRVATVIGKEATDIADLCKEMEQEEGVMACEQDAQVQTPKVETRSRRLMDEAMPDDPHYMMLADINKYLDHIHAQEAWNIHTGDGHVVVAVIDSGVNFQHPDLMMRQWMNPGETPNDGADNDGNGFVDDVHGWDFTSNHSDPSPVPPGNPMYEDMRWHGTHVAGIIGAHGNNSIGVTGVNWNVQIMSLKVARGDGSFSVMDLAHAVQYAAMNGAHVICLALSTSYSWYLKDAMWLARDHGALVVTSAGNDNPPGGTMLYYSSMPYPCWWSDEIENILCVTGIDPIGMRYGNYGHGVHLGAPAVDILSTYGHEAYKYMTGTSMATAVVAGAASLLWDLFPNADWRIIKNAMLMSSNEEEWWDPYSYNIPTPNLYEAMQIIGNSFWAGWAHPMHKTVPMMGDYTFDLPVGNKVVCADAENPPIGALEYSMHGHRLGVTWINAQVVNFSMAPMSMAGGCQFTDTNLEANMASGIFHVTGPTPSTEDFEHYAVWWANDGGPLEVVAKIPASGLHRGESNAPAWDRLHVDDTNFWQTSSGQSFQIHSDGGMSFTGPFVHAHRTLAQMFQAPFELYMTADNSTASAPIMIQIGGHSPASLMDSAGGVVIALLNGHTRMVRLPDGTTYMQPVCDTYDEWMERYELWLKVFEDSFNVSGGRCDDMHVSYSLQGLHKVSVGSECAGPHCSSMFDDVAYRSYTQTLGYSLMDLTPPSGANSFRVMTENVHGPSSTFVSCPFVDRSAADEPTAPSSVTASSPDVFSMAVTWTVEDLGTCVFSYWKLQIWNDDLGGPWTDQMCSSDMTATMCTAEGLSSNTAYRFRVLPVCSFGDGPASDPSAPVSTLAFDASAPFNLQTTPVTSGAMLSWQIGALNDCTFSEFVVNMRMVGTDSWSVAAGCTGLTSLSSLVCTATGLSSASQYRFRVSIMCEDDVGNSLWSPISAATTPA